MRPTNRYLLCDQQFRELRKGVTDMKKVFLIILAALMTVSVGAMAEGDPSVTIPSVTLDQITRIDGNQFPEGFIIEKLPESEISERMDNLHQNIATALESNLKLSEIFVNIQVSDALQLPDGIDNMMVCEFVPLIIKGAVPEIGDVKTLLTVPGEYAPEDHVLSLVGIVTTDEVVWIPLATEVIGKQIKVVFNAEVFSRLNAKSEVVLVLLRDNK